MFRDLAPACIMTRDPVIGDGNARPAQDPIHPNAGRPRRLVLISHTALYPIHWHAFRWICEQRDVEGHVIQLEENDRPSVHRQTGWIDVQQERATGFCPDVLVMPELRSRARREWLLSRIRMIEPDVIWWQGEPINWDLFAILRNYYWRREPRIVSALCENIFVPPPGHWVRFVKKRLLFPPLAWLLWRRLDGIVATARASIDGIRQIGMPRSVPFTTLVAGAVSPAASVEPLRLPFERQSDDYIVGFVGRICEEKGWRVLFEALAQLPPHFKCVVAGDGPEIDELKSALDSPALKGRVHFLGLLNKERLWQFYRALDCLAVPSLTRAHWKEQFGAVLTDGMAMGLPLVGSDSGSIPEVMGPAGLVFPEGDAARLAGAIRLLAEDPAQGRRLGEVGRNRFAREFAIPAYGAKLAAALFPEPPV